MAAQIIKNLVNFKDTSISSAKVGICINMLNLNVKSFLLKFICYGDDNDHFKKKCQLCQSLIIEPFNLNVYLRNKMFSGSPPRAHTFINQVAIIVNNILKIDEHSDRSRLSSYNCNKDGDKILPSFQMSSM